MQSVLVVTLSDKIVALWHLVHIVMFSKERFFFVEQRQVELFSAHRRNKMQQLWQMIWQKQRGRKDLRFFLHEVFNQEYRGVNTNTPTTDAIV